MRAPNPGTESNAPFSGIPVIDLAPWFASRRVDERRTLAHEVYAACATTGFMYVAGHGIAETLVESVFTQSRAFFALPAAEKARIDFRLAHRYRGYIPLQGESTDPAAAPDLKEAFDFGLVLDDVRAGGTVGARLRVANLWPAQPASFRPTLEAYFAAVRSLAETLFAIFALAFDRPPDFFASKIDRPIAQMRVLHYPSRPPARDEFGIGAHCDYECFTILAQDEVGGLEVQNEAGAWIAAPPLAGTFVINIGEMLARWTNDRFKATPHRVINRSGRERFSIPFFFATNWDTRIEPLTTRDSGEVPHYPPVLAGDYLAARLDSIYGAPAEAGEA